MKYWVTVCGVSVSIWLDGSLVLALQWLREFVLPLLPRWDVAHSIHREAEFLHRAVMRVTPLYQQEFLVLTRWKKGWVRCPGVPILLMKRTSKPVLVNQKCWQPGQSAGLKILVVLVVLSWKLWHGDLSWFLISMLFLSTAVHWPKEAGGLIFHHLFILTYYCQIIYLCSCFSFQFELVKEK